MGKYLTLYKWCGIICSMKKLEVVLGVMVLILSIVVIVLASGYNKMSHGDINRDGKVNVLDASILSTNWSK